MMYRSNNTITSKGKAVITRVFFAAIVFAVSLGSVNASSITGDMGITGAFGFTSSGGLETATLITLESTPPGDPNGTSGSGDIGTTVTFGTQGTIGSGTIDLASFSPITNLLTIGGWQVDLTSMLIVDQTASVLNLSGDGQLTGNGYDPTAATWTLSSNDAGSSYSMTVTASPVPVPAAVWLFGSGLIGLVGVARRRKI